MLARSTTWIQDVLQSCLAVEEADREAEEEAIERIRGDGQDRTGGGLVCMSMRFTVSNPKGDPPSLHVSWTLVADNQASQAQKQTQALRVFHGSMLLYVSASQSMDACLPESTGMQWQ